MAVLRVQVSGMVQGVGFRWFTRQLARRYNLAGWVKNRDDGSVEIAATGDDEDVKAFLNQVRVGPPGASVAQVQSLPTDGLAPLPHPFTIVR